MKADEITNIVEHLKSRGLDPERSDVVLDKQGNTATFLLYDTSGRMVGYQTYNPNGLKDRKNRRNLDLAKYYTYVGKEGLKGTKIAVWGLESLSWTDKYLFVTEGIFDAVKIQKAGYPAVAVLGNAGSPSLINWFKLLRQKIIAIMDNDDAGNELKRLSDMAYKVPEAYKDLGDMPQKEVNQFIKDVLKNKVKKAMEIDILKELKTATRLVKSFKYSDNDDYVTIYSGKRWPKITVFKRDEDSFDIVDFNSMQKVKKELKSKLKSDTRKIQELFENINAGMFYSIDDLLGLYEKGIEKERSIIKYLFHAIESAVSRAIRYPKTDLLKLLTDKPLADLVINKEYKRQDKSKLFDYMTKKMKMHPDTFTDLFGEFNIEESERIEHFEHGKWDIYVDEGVKVEPDKLIELLEDAEKALKRKGFGELAYGKVIAVNTLKGSVLADYLPSKDSIRVRTKGLRGSKGELHNLLHEIGHRNMHKKLNKEQLNDIRREYYLAKNDIPSVEQMGVERGDILQGENGSTYEVTGFKHPSVLAEMTSTDDKRRKRSVGKTFRIKPEALFSHFTVNGKKPEGVDSNAFFPTAYASKNSEEMYCELFADWLLGTLKDPAKEFMEQLHV